MRAVLLKGNRSKPGSGSKRTTMRTDNRIKLNNSQTFSQATFIRLLEDGDHRITEDGDLRILE